MASHKSETAPWRSTHRPRHARTTDVATASWDALNTARRPKPYPTSASLDLMQDAHGLAFDLARVADTLRRSVAEREARAEFDRLAERAPVRSLDLLRRNAS